MKKKITAILLLFTLFIGMFAPIKYDPIQIPKNPITHIKILPIYRFDPNKF